MRAVALGADVIVFVSDMWQTTCTAVRGGGEGFVIDSVLYPEELRALPDVLEQAEFPVSGLLTTHGDWDHVMGRLAFPSAALGAGEATVARLGAELGQAQRDLRAFDQEHYVDGRPPLALGSLQSLPVPGHLEIGSGPEAHELELHETGGHTADGVAYWLPWARVLVCGDYLSPVEIPMLSPGGSVEVYRGTLRRLKPLAEQAEWVVPGHGAPYPGQRTLEILAEDDAYLTALTDDPAATAVPASRSTPAQRKIHGENLAFVGAAAG
jgi:glyoxylase-like metal-dependent hydrolase (beta-lactamase superfamily II)